MKNFFKYTSWILLVLLIAANIFTLISGMKLSQEVSYLEKKTKQLRSDNMELEKQLYKTSSLQFAGSVAATLDFTKKAEPYFLENLGFALRE